MVSLPRIDLSESFVVDADAIEQILEKGNSNRLNICYVVTK